MNYHYQVRKSIVQHFLNIKYVIVLSYPYIALSYPYIALSYPYIALSYPYIFNCFMIQLTDDTQSSLDCLLVGTLRV